MSQPQTTNRPPQTSPKTDPKAAQTDAQVAQADAEAKAKANAQNDAEAKAKAEREAKAKADELSFISSPVILAPELVRESAPVNARNERQQAMDKTVEDLHARWVKAGQPSTWGAAVNAKVVATYFVEPERAEDHKKLITKAARLHRYTIRWGSSFQASADLVKRYGLPDDYVGREVISFFARSTRTRGAKNDGNSNGKGVASDA